MLGNIIDGRRQCLHTVYYDELDERAYSSGVCILTAKSFGKLWKICREARLTVVADIHTHIGVAFQSEADRMNPMIAEKGHIALIAPSLCCKATSPTNVSIFEYLGAHRWIDHSSSAENFFYVGVWA